MTSLVVELNREMVLQIFFFFFCFKWMGKLRPQREVACPDLHTKVKVELRVLPSLQGPEVNSGTSMPTLGVLELYYPLSMLGLTFPSLERKTEVSRVPSSQTLYNIHRHLNEKIMTKRLHVRGVLPVSVF